MNVKFVFHWRWVVLVALLIGPLLFLIGAGIYFLWQAGLWFYLWWPLTASFALAFFLAWRWQRRQFLLGLDFTPPMHWTERDRQAWKLVEARANRGEQISPDQLVSYNFYTHIAHQMAQELAQFYNPRASDPLGSRTLVEILAVIELASHDLGEMIDTYVPGGHLLTIDNWRTARKATDWYQTANKFYWMISGLLSPVNTSMRYLASQAGVTRPWQMLQLNLLLWFYSAFVHRVGTYLIDLNSGRLRVGAQRYRELMAREKPDPGVPPGAGALPLDGVTETPQAPTTPLTIGLIGPFGGGKTSLRKALLGPTPSEGESSEWILVDTIGYDPRVIRANQKRDALNAARRADLLLLVLSAKNPVTARDQEMVKILETFYRENPNLRRPPILGVLTHIDQLPPSDEWEPPYDWQQPQRVKEQQIAQAVIEARSRLGEEIARIVPVCTAPDKMVGIQEWLIPALAEHLAEALGVSTARRLHSEADRKKYRRVFHQLFESGKAAVRSIWRPPS